MQKLNFPGTAWRGLALIGTQKTCVFGLDFQAGNSKF